MNFHTKCIHGVLLQEWPLPPSITYPLNDMPCGLLVVSSVMHDSKVYVTGLAKDEKKVWRADMRRRVQVYSHHEGKGNWSKLPASNYNAPITTINDRIALVGGRNAETGKITHIVSTWNEVNQTWENDDLPPMPTSRLESGVCHHDNLLLVAGGIVHESQYGTRVQLHQQTLEHS